MIPLTVTREEMLLARGWVEEAIAAVKGTDTKGLAVTIGTMIETPRAALRADEIAEVADFFSFGTNDLTQMTFGFSRDDVEAPDDARLPRAGPAAAQPVRDDRPGRRRRAGRAWRVERGRAHQAEASSSACAASTAATPSRSSSSTASGSTTCPARRSGCRLPGWPPRRPSWGPRHLTPARSPKHPRCSPPSPLPGRSRPRAATRTSPTSTSSRGCGPRSSPSSSALLVADLLLVHARRTSSPPRKRRSRAPSGSRIGLSFTVVVLGGVGRPGGRRVHLRLPDREEPLASTTCSCGRSS